MSYFRSVDHKPKSPSAVIKTRFRIPDFPYWSYLLICAIALIAYCRHRITTFFRKLFGVQARKEKAARQAQESLLKQIQRDKMSTSYASVLSDSTNIPKNALETPKRRKLTTQRSNASLKSSASPTMKAETLLTPKAVSASRVPTLPKTRTMGCQTDPEPVPIPKATQTDSPVESPDSAQQVEFQPAPSTLAARRANEKKRAAAIPLSLMVDSAAKRHHRNTSSISSVNAPPTAVPNKNLPPPTASGSSTSRSTSTSSSRLISTPSSANNDLSSPSMLRTASSSSTTSSRDHASSAKKPPSSAKGKGKWVPGMPKPPQEGDESYWTMDPRLKSPTPSATQSPMLASSPAPSSRHYLPTASNMTVLEAPKSADRRPSIDEVFSDQSASKPIVLASSTSSVTSPDMSRRSRTYSHASSTRYERYNVPVISHAIPMQQAMPHQMYSPNFQQQYYAMQQQHQQPYGHQRPNHRSSRRQDMPDQRSVSAPYSYQPDIAASLAQINALSHTNNQVMAQLSQMSISGANNPSQLAAPNMQHSNSAQSFVSAAPSVTSRAPSRSSLAMSQQERESTAHVATDHQSGLEKRVREMTVAMERLEKELEISKWRVHCAEVDKEAELKAKDRQHEDTVLFLVERAEKAENDFKQYVDSQEIAASLRPEDLSLDERSRSDSISTTDLKFSFNESTHSSTSSPASKAQSPLPPRPCLHAMSPTAASTTSLMSPNISNSYQHSKHASPHSAYFWSPTPQQRFSNTRPRSTNKKKSRSNGRPTASSSSLYSGDASTSERSSHNSRRRKQDTNGDSDDGMVILLRPEKPRLPLAPHSNGQRIGPDGAEIVGLGLDMVSNTSGEVEDQDFVGTIPQSWRKRANAKNAQEATELDTNQDMSLDTHEAPTADSTPAPTLLPPRPQLHRSLTS